MDWTLGCNAASLPLSHRNNFAHDKIRTGFSKPSLASSISFPLALSLCTNTKSRSKVFGKQNVWHQMQFNGFFFMANGKPKFAVT